MYSVGSNPGEDFFLCCTFFVHFVFAVVSLYLFPLACLLLLSLLSSYLTGLPY